MSKKTRDGRLVSQLRRTILGTTPISTGLQADGDITLKDLYSYSSMPRVGIINENSTVGGQIRYNVKNNYTHYSINFPEEASVHHTTYYDPMGTKYDHWDISESSARGASSLSFIRDTSIHRRDIMSRQLRKINNQKFQKHLNEGDN